MNPLDIAINERREKLLSLLDELESMKNLAESNRDNRKLIRDSYGEAFYSGLYSGLQIVIIKIQKYISDF